MTFVSNGIRVSRARAALIASAGVLAILAAPGHRIAGQSDLVAAWGFSEGSGATAADESGNANTATLNGAAWTASGKFDAALTFDGMDDRADVPDANALDLSTDLTAEGWVYADASSQTRTLLAKEETGGIVYGLFLTSASKVELRVKAGGTLRSVTSVTSISASTWTHVAGTYDGSYLRVWINGLEENSLAATGSIAVSDQPLRIGGDTVLNQPFSGRIDEVRIYSRALIASEIVADMDVAVDDVTSPSVSAKLPAANASGVSVSANVTATFNESLAASTVTTSTFELRDPQNALVSAAVSYSDATKTATLDPASDLAGSTTYTATLKGGASTPRITDLAGNALVADHSWSFTTTDTNPPTVTGVTPAANTRNVSLSTTVAATFSEPLDSATVSTSTFELRDTRNTLVTGTVTYDAPTRIATFTPSAPLLPTRTYTATVIGGAGGVKDLAGNALVTNSSWSFISTVERTRIAAGATHAVAVDDAGQVWTWGSNTFGERGTALEPRLPGAVTLAAGVTSVAAGTSHTVALKSNGTLLSWGWNNEGQLGNGNQTNQTTPVAVSALTNVVAIAAGRTHSVALKSDGTVWTWGSGAQIGDGANLRRLTPVQVTSLSDVIAVAAGNDHSLALKADGTVWSWGVNTDGQLGDSTTTSPRLLPVQTVSLTGVVSIAAGNRHSLAVVGSNLSARGWGSNSHGQVGDGTSLNIRTSPVAVGTLTDVRLLDGGNNRSVAALLNGAGRIWGMQAVGSSASATPVAVSGNPTVWQIATGDSISLGVTSNGVVTTWTHGGNSQGQAGDGTYIDRPSAISISEAGYAWKAGTPMFNPSSGSYGSTLTVQLTSATTGATIRYTTNGSDPLETDPVVPANGQVSISQTTTLTAKTFKAGQPASNSAAAVYTLFVPLPTFSVASGTYNVPQTVVITAIAETVIRYTTNGAEPTEADPVVASGGSVAIDVSRTLKAKAWRAGWTPSGTQQATYTLKVGTPSATPGTGSYAGAQTVTVSTVTPNATLRYTVSGLEPTSNDPIIASGSAVAIDRSSTLRVKGWKTGWTNSDTRVAIYSLSLGTVAAPVASPAGGTYATAQTVSLSSTTAGAVIRYTDDGSDPSLLSRPYTAPIPIRVQTVLKARAFKLDWTPSSSASETYTLDATAVQAPTVTPGAGDYGARQVVTVTNATVDAVIHYTTDGLEPTESDPVVASGATLTVDRSMRLKVKAWKTGLLPSATRVADYSILGAIAAGDRHTLALKVDGTVWSWGLNTSGELGDGTQTSPRSLPGAVGGLSDVVAIAAGMRHNLAVRRDGTVWGWGSNANGQLGIGSTGGVRTTPVQAVGLNNVIAVAAGENHSLALRRDGTVVAWGGGTVGVLGLGPGVSTATTPTQIPNLTGVVAIAAAPRHSLALKTDGAQVGTVWAWGSSNSGQLGDGQTGSTRWEPTVVFDSAIAIVARDDSSFAVLSDRTARAWGLNTQYRLGDGTLNSYSSTPVVMQRLSNVARLDVTSPNTYALTTEGSIWAWGSAEGAGFPLLVTGGFVLEIPERVPVTGTGHFGLAGGSQHIVTAHRDGRVWTWGRNDAGQLGNGTLTLNWSPTPVPNFSLTTSDWSTSDPDGDGVPNWRELLAGTDPRVADTNGDGIPDGAALASGTNATNPDMDGDGVLNAVETARGTDPFRSDTDADGVSDGADAFPLDPSRSQPPTGDPADTTPPVINLTYPASAVPIPPV
jgi:alpha-tubulin suppressor-like RCC1 family protein